MRSCALLPLLIACSTTDAPVDPPEAVVGDRVLPPPGVPLDLQVGALEAGGTLTLVVTGADPGESVYLTRSVAGMGAGPCPAPLQGTCLDVVDPVILPGSPFAADAAGAVPFSVTLPPTVPEGVEVCFQAVAARRGLDVVKSPVVCRVVDAGPIGLEGGANTGDDVDEGLALGTGNVLLAMKHVAPADQTVGYLEVFTGGVVGTQRLQIWSHDAAADEPLQRVASTSWTSTEQLEWQGAPLDTPVQLAAGSTWWIVWDFVGGSQASRATSGTPVEVRAGLVLGTPIVWYPPLVLNEKFKLCAPGGCP